MGIAVQYVDACPKSGTQAGKKLFPPRKADGQFLPSVAARRKKASDGIVVFRNCSSRMTTSPYDHGATMYTSIPYSNSKVRTRRQSCPAGVAPGGADGPRRSLLDGASTPFHTFTTDAQIDRGRVRLLSTRRESRNMPGWFWVRRRRREGRLVACKTTYRSSMSIPIRRLWMPPRRKAAI